MAYSKGAMLFGCILLLSFALIVSMGESKVTFHKRSMKQSNLVCNEVYAQQDGDTCSSIIEAFGLTAATFSSINPNLNCNKIFIGEWLCVDGSST